MKPLLTTLGAIICLGVPAMAAAPTTASNEARAAAREYGTAVRNCDMVWALERMYPPLVYTMADQMAGSGETSEKDRARRIMGVQKDGADTGAAESEQQAQKRRSEGLKKLRQQYTKMGRDLKASGFTVEKFDVGAATAEYVVASPTSVIRTIQSDTTGSRSVESLQDGQSRSRIVILPTRLVCSAPDAQGKVRRIQRDSFIYAIRDEVRGPHDKGSGAELNKWYFIDGNTSVNQIRAFFPKLPLNLRLPVCGDKVLN